MKQQTPRPHLKGVDLPDTETLILQAAQEAVDAKEQSSERFSKVRETLSDFMKERQPGEIDNYLQGKEEQLTNDIEEIKVLLQDFQVRLSYLYQDREKVRRAREYQPHEVQV